MIDQMCVLLVLVFAVTSFAELIPESEPCNLKCVLGRLADLEQKQRDSDAENRELREVITQQQSTIEAQAERLQKLEQTVTAFQHPETPRDNDGNLEQDNKGKRHLKSVSKSSNSWQSGHRHTGDVIKPPGKRQEVAGIAFSAYLDHNADLASHQTIKFNRIILNEGNGYNIHTGVFTCPSSGVYLLTFSVGGRDSHNLRVFMVKNSQNIVDANADSMHSTQELQGGNTVMIRLNANDVVWIEADEHSNVEGSSTIRLSSFSGALLYP